MRRPLDFALQSVHVPLERYDNAQIPFPQHEFCTVTVLVSRCTPTTRFELSYNLLSELNSVLRHAFNVSFGRLH